MITYTCYTVWDCYTSKVNAFKRSIKSVIFASPLYLESRKIKANSITEAMNTSCSSFFRFTKYAFQPHTLT